MSVPDRLQHVLTSEGCHMHCSQELSVQLTIYTQQIVLGKVETACSKPEQLFSRQEYSLLHSEKHPLINPDSARSYESNSLKEKHCDPGKFVSLTVPSIYGAVMLLLPWGHVLCCSFYSSSSHMKHPVYLHSLCPSFTVSFCFSFAWE